MWEPLSVQQRRSLLGSHAPQSDADVERIRNVAYALARLVLSARKCDDSSEQSSPSDAATPRVH